MRLLRIGTLYIVFIVYYYEVVVKKRPNLTSATSSTTNCQDKQLKVIEIGYVHTPDAYERLSRAITILLLSAEKSTAASNPSENTGKEEKSS